MKQDQTKQANRLTRREFLGRSTQAAAGIAAGGALAAKTLAAPAISSRILGANDRINMAIIGIRSQGRAHIRSLAKIPNVHIKTLCDVDENLFADRIKAVTEAQGSAPGTAADMRHVFDDQDISAVAMATPNHWHALGTIWAVQAGKHVYVEKPASHNIWEGRKMVEAARKYNRLVQIGFQSRSNRNAQSGMRFLREGKLGYIYMARGLCIKPRGDIGRYPDGPLKEGETYSTTIGGRGGASYTAAYLEKVDYDLWLGPAPKRKFNRNRFHYNWHWHWDYGNGDTGNQGPHQFDMARWGLGKNEHPVKVRSFGGYFAYDSSQETPNTQTSIFEYADGTILEFATRGLYTNLEANEVYPEQGIKIGALFYGTEGWMYMRGEDYDNSWKTYYGRKNELGPTSDDFSEGGEPEGLGGADLIGTGGGHFDNFIAAIRSGKRTDLTGEVEEGHMSSVLPHLGNISYLVGRDLTFDGKKEKFVGDKAADKLLTRKYRKPYVVPAKV